jgi:hypothetical protein
MTTTTDRRARIKAIAADPRGDSATRAIANRWLADHPEPQKLTPVFGVTPSEDYLRWKKAQHIPKKK